MTREIKFRAWDKKNNMWHSSWASIFPWGTQPSDTSKVILDIMPEYFEFNQYTGLKDKNGKEIYEGDIVEWKYLKTWHKNEVRWVGGGFVVTTSGFKDDLNEPQDLSLVSILNCEIIGNIYSNPELLK